jgi:hypothetical protein
MPWQQQPQCKWQSITTKSKKPLGLGREGYLCFPLASFVWVVVLKIFPPEKVVIQSDHIVISSRIWNNGSKVSCPGGPAPQWQCHACHMENLNGMSLSGENGRA